MKIEEQLVSLELAAKLKELGIEQNSQWFWSMFDTCGGTAGACKKNDYGITIDYEVPRDEEYRDCFSAFTATELLEMLPETIETKSDKPTGYSYYNMKLFYSSVNRKQVVITYSDYDNKHLAIEQDLNLCNALAKMLIYLKQNNLTN